jgi:hypothetical protein
MSVKMIKYNSFEEIKKAVDKGEFVYWKNRGYAVCYDEKAKKYLVWCIHNNHFDGLFHLNNIDSSYNVSDFYSIDKGSEMRIVIFAEHNKCKTDVERDDLRNKFAKRIKKLYNKSKKQNLDEKIRTQILCKKYEEILRILRLNAFGKINTN